MSSSKITTGCILYLAMTFILMSCSNELHQDGEAPNSLASETSFDDETLVLAKMTSQMEVDVEMIREVLDAVNLSLKYGLGETVRFRDLFNTTESKILEKDMSFSISQKLKVQYVKQENARNSQESFFDKISKEDMQITWPHSNRWNGKDIPEIIWKSQEEGSLYYKIKFLDNGLLQIEEVFFDREYVRDNPVWIINKNVRSYEELPDFRTGEKVNSDGVYFLGSEDVTAETKAAWPEYPTKGLYIFKMFCNENYDGGDIEELEFRFFWCYGQAFLNEPVRGFCNQFSYDMPASQFGREFQFSRYFVGGMAPGEIQSCLVVHEADGGLNRTGTRTVKYKYSDGRVGSADVSFRYQKRDDLVHNYYLSYDEVYNNNTIGGELKERWNDNKSFYIKLLVNDDGSIN